MQKVIVFSLTETDYINQDTGDVFECRAHAEGWILNNGVDKRLYIILPIYEGGKTYDNRAGNH